MDFALSEALVPMAHPGHLRYAGTDVRDKQWLDFSGTGQRRDCHGAAPLNLARSLQLN
jgi:hypothetical protein